MIFLNESFNLKDELFCRGGALKYKEKKTLECLMCRVRHPCEGGSSPSDQGQKPIKDILPGILNFWGKIRYEN